MHGSRQMAALYMVIACFVAVCIASVKWHNEQYSSTLVKRDTSRLVLMHALHV